MATIAILGAGLGGLLAAYEVKGEACPSDRVVLISKGDTYHFVPSNPWVAVNWRKRDSIEVKLAIRHEAKGHRLHPDGGEESASQRK